MHEHEPWVTVEDVAKHLSVADDSVHRWTESKSLSAHRVRRMLKLKLPQVDTRIEVGGAAKSDNEKVKP